MDKQLHNARATLSKQRLVNNGSGMANLWHYPGTVLSVVGEPLQRLIVFDTYAVAPQVEQLVDVKKGCVVVSAVVSHLAYGVVRARGVVVAGVGVS